MDLKDKYKLALFGVIRNSTVMPAGVKLGKVCMKLIPCRLTL